MILQGPHYKVHNEFYFLNKYWLQLTQLQTHIIEKNETSHQWAVLVWIWEAKVFRCLQFYNCTYLESLLKPCRCNVSSQSSEPLKNMHNKQSLKYVCSPGHMVLSGVSWIFGSVHCWKMGLQGPTSQSSCQKPYQKESAVAWLFAFCGS